MSVTYTKLQSGDWGIKIQGGPLPESGTSVTVVKKSGDKKTERIDKILWSGSDAKTGDAVYLCSVERGTFVGRQTFGRVAYRCGCDCCRPCRCESHCVCRGGNVWDCE